MKKAAAAPKHAGLIVRRVLFKNTDPFEDNPRFHPPKGSPEWKTLDASLADEYFDPLVWNKRNKKMVSGHYRRTILMDRGFESADMVVVDWDNKTHKARLLAANQLNGQWDEAKLLALVKQIGPGIDAELTGMTDAQIKAILDAAAPAEDASGEARTTLAQRFGVPPFSVLDARQGYWQERKRAWLALGIKSEIGRGANLLKMSDTVRQPDPAKRKGEQQKKANPTLGAVAANVEARGESGHFYRKKNKAADAKTFGTEGNAAGDWTGTSIFDPVLCEMAYRWFCPPDGRILDPFAGGSVRGVVAGLLGREYVGIDLRKEQVVANAAQWKAIGRVPLSTETGTSEPKKGITDPEAITPVEQVAGFFFKRDDYFEFGGANGGKTRALLKLAQAGNAKGIVTCGDRESTQLVRAAQVAKELGIECRLHTSAGADSFGMTAARMLGAEIIQHHPGRLSQVKKWAWEDAKDLGLLHVPWGNVHPDAVSFTADQCANLLEAGRKIRRIVVPVGSGATLAGILRGMIEHGINCPVLGVRLGAKPDKALEMAPKGWEKMVEFADAKIAFHDEAPEADQTFEGVPLDPIYEAKCVPFLKPGDLLWIVGRRSVGGPRRQIKPVAPKWVVGDSHLALHHIGKGDFDFLWTCPPYFDLEVYSDDQRDLSRAGTYNAFLGLLSGIIADACSLLKEHAFAGIVVGDIRDENGIYRNFVSDTIGCFQGAGMRLYNEAILVTSVGTLPIRIAKQFTSSRKLGKTHQNVLIFVKGDPRKATAAIGPVEFGDIPTPEETVDTASGAEISSPQ